MRKVGETATLFCLFALAALPAASRDWPTLGWASSTPAAEGLDETALRALDGEFAAGTHGYIDGILVIRSGRVVFERSYAHDYDRLFVGKGKPGPYNYYDPDWYPYYKRGPLHTLQSVSKSVTSTLLGVALRRGEVTSIDAKALPFFDGFKVAKADPRRDAMTIRDLLTMRSGIRWDEDTVPYTDPKNSCAAMEASNDWVQFVLDQPMAAAPGTTFVYNSGVTMLLAQILKKATNRLPDEYAAEHLFAPLGIKDFYWKRTPTGLMDAEGGLHLTARDLAKLGFLFLNDGVWDGKRILPEGWAGQSTTPIVSLKRGSEARGYGFQWWSLREPGVPPAFAALGYGGQQLIVVPDLELIGVFTGWNIYDKPSLSQNLVLRRLVGAVRRKR